MRQGYNNGAADDGDYEQMMDADELNMRPIYEIATEIQKDWKKMYFGAVPYVDAMFSLTNINERYGCDSAESIILYFLANAGTWRGDTARRIKAELKAMSKR